MIATSTNSVPNNSIGDDAGIGIIASAGKSRRKSGATTVRFIEVKCDSASCAITNAAVQARIDGHAAGVYDEARQTMSTRAMVAPPRRCSQAGPRKMAIAERPVVIRKRNVKRTLY